MTDDLLDLFENFELPASEEVHYLDKALEESKKIQSLLEASTIQLEKLSSRNEESSSSYYYNITPSKRLSHSCAKTEYEIFSLYNTHLSYLLRQKLGLCSPQRHHRIRKISYASSISSSSSPSASSNEHINQIEDARLDEEEHTGSSNGHTVKVVYGYGCRTRKDFLKTYNRTKTERIKCKRELESSLMGLDKALTLSSTRAREAKNYNWLRERMKVPKKTASLSSSLICHGRRSISTSICRIKHSTPVHAAKSMTRPMSSSVIF